MSIPSPLQGLADRHFAVMNALVNTQGGRREPQATTALAAIALNRSYRTLLAFDLLHSAGCLSAASALVRLQIDSAMRMNAAYVLDDAETVLHTLRTGGQLRSLRDVKERLTDFYLHRKLSENFPWVSDLYEDLSGYVHLSGVHASAAVSDEPSGQRIILAIGYEAPTAAQRHENFDLFFRSTELVLEVAESFLSWAGSPSP